MSNDTSSSSNEPKESSGSVVSFPMPDDSHVLTFHLEGPNLRGRIVRLGTIFEELLNPHRYPPVMIGGTK